MNNKFDINPHIKWRKLGEKVSLLDIKSGEYHILNETASEIWILMSEGKNYEDIINFFNQKYGLKKGIFKIDLELIIEDFKSKSLIS